MKARSKLAIAVLVSSFASPLSPQAQAGSSGAFNVSEGNLSYTYVSRALSVSEILQTNDSNTANVAQNSTRNISSVTQIGLENSATVVQTGTTNRSIVNQYGIYVPFGAFSGELSFQ